MKGNAFSKGLTRLTRSGTTAGRDRHTEARATAQCTAVVVGSSSTPAQLKAALLARGATQLGLDA